MPPAARIGDATSHLPNPTPIPVLVGTGAITGPPLVPTVLIAGQPAAVVASLATCAFPAHIPPLPPMPLIPVPTPGKAVLIGGLPAARLGDKLPCGAAVVGGAPTVHIGG